MGDTKIHLFFIILFFLFILLIVHIRGGTQKFSLKLIKLMNVQLQHINRIVSEFVFILSNFDKNDNKVFGLIKKIWGPDGWILIHCNTLNIYSMNYNCFYIINISH